MLDLASISDPDQFTAYARSTGARVAITATGRFAGELAQISLPRMRVQINTITGSCIYHTVLDHSLVSLSFHTGPNAPSVRRGRHDFPADTVTVWNGDTGCYTRAPHGFSWGSIVIPAGYFAAASALLADRELLSRGTPLLIKRPDPDMLADLQALTRRAIALSRYDPSLLARSETVRAFDDRLMRVSIACIASSRDPVWVDTREQTRVMRRFEELIVAAGSRPLYVGGVCAELGVAEVTLRRYCHDQIGMTPHAYLRRRRLMLVHRALLWADPQRTTVKQIAVDFGFPDRVRFARLYRNQFGENPSTTLRVK